MQMPHRHSMWEFFQRAKIPTRSRKKYNYMFVGSVSHTGFRSCRDERFDTRDTALPAILPSAEKGYDGWQTSYFFFLSYAFRYIGADNKDLHFQDTILGANKVTVKFHKTYISLIIMDSFAKLMEIGCSVKILLSFLPFKLYLLYWNNSYFHQ